MAYTKTTWVDDVTTITAEKMNNIENGIENVENAIPTINTSKNTSTTDTYSCSYINDLESALKTNNVLWSDSSGSYMGASQKAQLSGNISNQKSGIILAFSPYVNGEGQNYAWNFVFIPKYFLSMPGTGFVCNLVSSKYDTVGTKYLYLYDTYIQGMADNTLSGTGSGSGIKYNNAYWVLRYVIGV